MSLSRDQSQENERELRRERLTAQADAEYERLCRTPTMPVAAVTEVPEVEADLGKVKLFIRRFGVGAAAAVYGMATVDEAMED